MATRVPAQDAGDHLAEYLERAARQNERFLVERDGKPLAAVVSVEDLRRLEALDTDDPDKDPVRQAAFRQAMAEAGVQVTSPTGPPVQPYERTLLVIDGPPLSAQIIA